MAHRTAFHIPADNFTMQSPNEPFKIRSVDGYIIFLPDNEIKRICMKSETTASLDNVIKKYFSTKYTSLGANVPVFLKGIQLGFVRKLSLFVNPMMDEAERACSRLLGLDTEWQSVNLHHLAGQLAAQVSARAFVGQALCGKPEWMETLLGYTGKQWAAVRAVQQYPWWARGLVYRSLEAVKALRREEQHTASLLEPHFLSCLSEADDAEETLTRYFLAVTSDREQCDVMHHLLTLHLRLNFTALRRPRPSEHTLLADSSVGTKFLRQTPCQRPYGKPYTILRVTQSATRTCAARYKRPWPIESYRVIMHNGCQDCPNWRAS